MGRRRPILFLLLLAAPIGAAFAQAQRTIWLRADNDAFNFWTMPWNRPDGEYTSGVHITYDGGTAPKWSRWLWRNAAPCVVGAQNCQMARAEIGQDIYTPSLRVSDPEPAPGARPNAGWLYVSQSARLLTTARSDELTLTLGVTGPPSLARFTQRIAHAAAPEFNRPTDWTKQIGFEPGVMARYAMRRHVSAVHGVLDFIPEVAATAGNVNTSAEAGVQMRVGYRMRHPWLQEKNRASVAIVSGVSTRAIARDLFLDGNTFRGGERVGHRPFVVSGEAGVELRYGPLIAAYRSVATSRTYARGPRWHPWSSMVAGVTFDQ
jgi:hypothetical protein